MRRVGFAVVLLLVAAGCADASRRTGELPESTFDASETVPAPQTTAPVAEATPDSVVDRVVPICGSFPGGHSFGGSLEFGLEDLDGYGAENREVWGGAVVRNSVSVEDDAVVETPATVIAVVTGDVATHEAALRQVVGDDAVVDVRLGERTLEELEAIRGHVDRVVEGQGSVVGTSVHVPENQVMVKVDADNDPIRRLLADAAPNGSVCLAPYTGEMTAWGVQTVEGDGWRLVGESLRTPVYSVSAATSEEGFEAMWHRHFTGVPPTVDFNAEVVILFGATTSTCPEILLQGITISDDPPLVSPAIVDPNQSGACHQVAQPHGYAVAIERSALPTVFTVDLGVDIPDRPRLEVDLADLTADESRWGPIALLTVLEPADLDHSLGFGMQFFDNAGYKVIDGTGAIEVTPGGRHINTTADGQPHTLPGPGSYRLVFDVVSFASGQPTKLGECEATIDLPAFAQIPVTIAITHNTPPPGDTSPCQITIADQAETD